MTSPDELFREAVVIDGVNPSRWGDQAVFRAHRDGGITAVNATTAVIGMASPRPSITSPAGSRGLSSMRT